MENNSNTKQQHSSAYSDQHDWLNLWFHCCVRMTGVMGVFSGPVSADRLKLTSINMVFEQMLHLWILLHVTHYDVTPLCVFTVNPQIS